MAARRDPFNCFVSGNLNISIYGWSVPLSFSYSNQKATFRQPFNQYGLSPTYRWITMHAGYRSMVFSNYTVNGHLFLGAGADLTPRKNLRLSGFYGRLQAAVKEDTLREHNLPAYERKGGGVKLTLGDQSRFVDLIVFTASDDPGSLALPPAPLDRACRPAPPAAASRPLRLVRAKTPTTMPASCTKPTRRCTVRLTPST